MTDIVLFHFTTKQSLQGIIDEGGLTPTSEEKVFVLTKLSVINNPEFIQHLYDYTEDHDEIPAVLRITIPVEEFDAFDMYKTEDDEDGSIYGWKCPLDSWYFEENQIPISSIEMAEVINEESSSAKLYCLWLCSSVDSELSWSFKPLADFNNDMFAGLPFGVTDEYDVSEDFMEANKELFERVKEDE